MEKLRPMIYEKCRDADCTTALAHGEIDGYEYYILTYCDYPGAYVRLPKGHPLRNIPSQDINLPCGRVCSYAHRGLAVRNSDGIVEAMPGTYIGWDYAQKGDCVYGLTEGKRWNTEEILANVEDVIKWLKKAA